MATYQQCINFLKVVAPIAQDQAKKHGNKIFTSVCIAQACCESAYGTSPKMVRANALFGIKVGSAKPHFGTAWKDKAYSTATKECYDGKNYVQITDMFRAYDSIEEAVEDYFDLLCTAKRYRYALNQPTPLACIQGIQKAPYATSPTYVNTIMTIIKKWDLTQYDGGVKATATTTATIGRTSTNTIRLGDRGDDVKWLQTALNLRGYILKVDGIAGNVTIGAVMDFQKKNGLVCDGIVGARTRAALLS